MRQNISHQLQIINDERAHVLLPAMILIGCMMLFGIIGNSLVIYIFLRKFKVTTQTTLFLALACFDLMSSSIAMPFEIFDLRYFFTFESSILCKFMRSWVAFPIMASNQVLLLIAIDRYLKVCRPLKKQIIPHLARKLILLSVALSIVFTVPAFLIYGTRSAWTHVPGLLGSDCSTSDDMKDSIFPVIYEGLLLVVFVCFVIILGVLYGLIWRVSQRKAFRSHVFRERGRLLSHTSSSDHGHQPPKTFKFQVSTCEDTHPGDLTTALSFSSGNLRNGLRTSKSTIIAFTVTTVFFLSFLPHLGLVLMKNIKKDFDYHLENAELVAFNIFLRSFFVNPVAHPVVYATMNARFRHECVCLIKRLTKCCFCVKDNRRKPEPKH
ncbi:hypothetical protein SNE40_021628 [Patella caerulea]|uniref:G-protein coupled receptors family 1 profile domain-containing protein n=1 Tax=Patella caerulea TaxID=87958 RepID=A0AAN8FZX3_PATCE